MATRNMRKTIVALLLGSAITTLLTLRLINELESGERDGPVTDATAFSSRTTLLAGMMKREAASVNNVDVSTVDISTVRSPSNLSVLLDSPEAKSVDHSVGDERVKPSSTKRLLPTHNAGFRKNATRLEDPRWGSRHENYLVVVVVFSSATPRGEMRRSVVRATWLSPEMTGDASFTYWFALGLKNVSLDVQDDLRREQEVHGDLLILWDVRNSYEDLAERTLRSMHYLFTRYSFAYFLKTDDDMFLNMPVLFHEMEHLRPRQRLYWGSFSCHNPPQVSGQWLETRWRSCDVYFPYAYGGMYVLTRDVVRLVANSSRSLETYANEDVSMGAWLAPYNLYHLNDPRIHILHEQLCSRGFIAIHNQGSVSRTGKQYLNLKKKGITCSAIKTMDVLSWKRLPSECWWEHVLIA